MATRRTKLTLTATVVGVVSVGLAAGLAAAFASARDEEPERAALIEAAGPPSDYQDAALADGVVTDEEMTHAVQDTVACLRESGLDARVLPAGQGGIALRWEVVTQDRSNTDPKGCEDRFIRQLQLAYAMQKHEEGWSAERAAFDACMAARGFDLNESAREPDQLLTYEQFTALNADPSAKVALFECDAEVRQ